MLRNARNPLIAALAMAALCSLPARAQKVLVPADPDDDPAATEIIIKNNEPVEKKVIRKKTVKKTEAAPKAVAAPKAAPKEKVMVNNITIHGGKGDSLALARARQDSLALAEKARRDSLALAAQADQEARAHAETRRRLELEMSRRTDMEKQLLATGLLVLDAVYFETAKTDISINSRPYLDMLARMLTKYPKLQLEVAGHTDHVGSDSYNLNLSQGRAAAVRDYMASREPSLAGRLTARGYGESRPKADNLTPEGRMYNRRTELQVLNKEALEEYNRPEAVSRDEDAGTEGSGVGGSMAPPVERKPRGGGATAY